MKSHSSRSTEVRGRSGGLCVKLNLQRRGESITVIEGQVLGSGGEARVFAIEGHPEWAAKVYHKPDPRHAAKLAVMVANPPEDPMAAQGHASIAWPLDLLVDSAGTVTGFLMPRVNNTRPIIDYFNPKSRLKACSAFNYFYLLRTARNLSAALHAIHSRGYVVGDINDSNILVSQTALVTLVDTDSFQVHDAQRGECYRCPVGRPEFSPPEVLARVGRGLSYASMDRATEQDLFGLAVLIFQLLMEGTHPFAGIYKGQADAPTYSERILAGHFAYYQAREMPYQPSPLAPPWELLHPWLQQAFMECFIEGHNQPGARYGALAWARLLDQVAREVIYCKVNGQHVYWPHVKNCPWCARKARLGGRDPFPALAAAPPPIPVAAPVASGVVSKPPIIAPPALPSRPTPQTTATPQAKPAAKPVVRIVTRRGPTQVARMAERLNDTWSWILGLCKRRNVLSKVALALSVCVVACLAVVAVVRLARHPTVMSTLPRTTDGQQPAPAPSHWPESLAPKQVRQWWFQLFQNVQMMGPQFGAGNDEAAELLCVSFMAGDQQLVIGTRAGAQVWEVSNSRVVRALPPPQARSEYGNFTSIAVAPNHQTLALAAESSSAHQGVEVWDGKTGLLATKLSLPGGGFRKVTQMAFSPDERKLAVGLESQPERAGYSDLGPGETDGCL